MVVRNHLQPNKIADGQTETAAATEKHVRPEMGQAADCRPPNWFPAVWALCVLSPDLGRILVVVYVGGANVVPDAP